MYARICSMVTHSTKHITTRFFRNLWNCLATSECMGLLCCVQANMPYSLFMCRMRHLCRLFFISQDTFAACCGTCRMSLHLVITSKDKGTMICCTVTSKINGNRTDGVPVVVWYKCPVQNHRNLPLILQVAVYASEAIVTCMLAHVRTYPTAWPHSPAHMRDGSRP
jgi:hypothetical protein